MFFLNRFKNFEKGRTLTNQKVLVLFNNIYICPMPRLLPKQKNCAHAHIWEYVVCHNSAILGSIWLKLFKGALETYIYCCWWFLFFNFLNCWANLGGQMGVANTRAPNSNGRSLGLSNPTRPKICPIWWTFWANQYHYKYNYSIPPTLRGFWDKTKIALKPRYSGWLRKIGDPNICYL